MMKLNFDYNEKKNISCGYKILGKETNYYLGIAKICPICSHTIIGYPAISRKDNKTEICSNCGTLEALEDFIKYKEINDGKRRFKKIAKGRSNKKIKNFRKKL